MSNIDPEIKEWIKSAISQVLEPHRFSPRLLHKNLWEYEHDFDFIYGQKSGMIIGLIFGYYVKKFGRHPDEVEMADIANTLQSYRDEIKKNSRKR